jgi:DNA mismatch repair protein MutS
VEAGLNSVQRFHDVTVVDESASRGEAPVSTAGTVVPDDPAQRPHKVERNPADGLACAALRATGDGLTYDSLRWRIR